ncbi:hypothetical protein QVD17_27949 [Tagetes erecta]|uniref:Protein CHROMATIN REMODELING 24 n=1 Tax=Tagetes erecta TaxID=13708 RepID=A0AAD8NRU8_TARER|nr:hypothetical protein QVD17_27949 [Tagetes erecta]
MAEEESSKKKSAMSLNQLHNRFLTASRSKSSAYGFISEMKTNPERDRQQDYEYDGPSFDIANFDSPSPPKTLEKTTNGEKFHSLERSDNGEDITSVDQPEINGLEYSSSEKVSSKVMTEDEFQSVEEGEIGTSFDEPVSSIGDEVDSQHGDMHQKVKIEGRRRLCKVVVKDDEEEVDKFDDVESDFSETVADFDSPSPAKNIGNKFDGGDETVADFDSPSPAKNTGNHFDGGDEIVADFDLPSPAKNIGNQFDGGDEIVADFDSPNPAKNIGNQFDGGDEIRDILSNLSSKFEILSIDKGKRPVKQLSSSSDLEEKFNEHKPVKISEHAYVENTSFLFAPNAFESAPKATATRKEHNNGGHVKSQARKAVSTKSFVHLQKSKDITDDDDDDDDDCVVTSGQKFVPKVEDRCEKLGQKSDVSNMAYTLSDKSCDSISGDEVPFSLSNPKFSFSLPSKIANMLYPHQREGLKWLWSLHCKGKGGILGDDMGLGKTMQICGFLAGLFHSNLIKRVLVVAPKTLLPHWMKELGVVNLLGKTREYYGTCAKARQYELQYILQDKGVLLTTYDIVRNNFKALSGNYDEMEDDAETWDYMILDEGHLIKNPSTQRAKSLLAIPCAHRIIISGTPLQNNLKELWALFNFCCPELLGDKKCFKERYESAILRGNDKKASDRDKRIGSAVAQDLRNCIQPYFLRRLKNEVFREDGGDNTAKLSKKNEIIVWLKLSLCQRQLYEAFLNSEIVLSAFDGSPLAAITILKKICDHPLLLTKRAAEDVLEGMESVLNQEEHGVAEKLAMHIADAADKYDLQENHDNISCKISFIVSLLDNLIPEGHNVLIFSQTRKMLNLIQDTLNARGYKFLRIDGTTKPSDRLKIVNDFQEGNAAPIFLLTSQVGGLGLTLTKADRVIVADPAWNPSTDAQSVDRAYRIGQKKDVVVYRLMTCGTVEEKIYRKQIYKGGLFKSATEHKEQIRYFSQQDLRELFSLPKQGFDVSLTQQQLHEEHDCEHKMDPSLKAHTKFLESLGIAGISNHSLLFSRTAPVPDVTDEELTRIRQSTYVGNSYSRPPPEQNVDAAQFAINPKDVARSKHISPKISNKLTESEIKQQINRLSQVYANKAMVSRLGDNGEKIRKQIAELNSELHKLQLLKAGGTEIIDLEDDFKRVMHV